MHPITQRLPPIWSYRQGLAVLLGFLLLYTALSTGHLLWVKWGEGFPSYLGSGPRLPPKLLLTSQGLKAIAIAVALWGLALRLPGLSWQALGLRRCSQPWLWLALLGACAGFALGLALVKSLAMGMPDWLRHMASRYGWYDGPAWQMLLLIGMTVLVTPLAEELFFRGFLLRWMASHRPLWVALLFSSLMFGASHLAPAQAIVASLLSLLLSLLYLGSGSIWPAVLCHALNNALGMLLGMAAVAGKLPAMLTPPAA